MIEPDEVEPADEKMEYVGTSTDSNPEDLAMIEPQPITVEDIIDTHENEMLIAEVDPTDESYIDIEVMYGGPDGWEDFNNEDLLDEDDFLLADNDDETVDDLDNFDIDDDILA